MGILVSSSCSCSLVNMNLVCALLLLLSCICIFFPSLLSFFPLFFSFYGKVGFSLILVSDLNSSFSFNWVDCSSWYFVHVQYIFFSIDSVFILVLGHGGSDGLHAYVHSLNEAVTDTVHHEAPLKDAYIRYLLELFIFYWMQLQMRYITRISSIWSRNHLLGLL